MFIKYIIRIEIHSRFHIMMNYLINGYKTVNGDPKYTKQ